MKNLYKLLFIIVVIFILTTSCFAAGAPTLSNYEEEDEGYQNVNPESAIVYVNNNIVYSDENCTNVIGTLEDSVFFSTTGIIPCRYDNSGNIYSTINYDYEDGDTTYAIGSKLGINSSVVNYFNPVLPDPNETEIESTKYIDIHNNSTLYFLMDKIANGYNFSRSGTSYIKGSTIALVDIVSYIRADVNYHGDKLYTLLNNFYTYESTKGSVNGTEYNILQNTNLIQSKVSLLDTTSINMIDDYIQTTNSSLTNIKTTASGYYDTFSDKLTQITSDNFETITAINSCNTGLSTFNNSVNNKIDSLIDSVNNINIPNNAPNVDITLGGTTFGDLPDLALNIGDIVLPQLDLIGNLRITDFGIFISGCIDDIYNFGMELTNGYSN